jgi:hypothetical protein
MRLPMHYSHLLRDEVLCVGGISIWLLVVGRIPLLKRSVVLMKRCCQRGRLTSSR